MGSVAWLDDQRRRRSGNSRDDQVFTEVERIRADLNTPDRKSNSKFR